MQLTPEVTKEIKQLLFSGRFMEAIKRVKDLTGGDLQQAKSLVELLGREKREEPEAVAAAPVIQPMSPQAGFHADVLRLLDAGRMVEAVKLVRDRTGLSLYHAKAMVDRMQMGRTTGRKQIGAAIRPGVPPGGDFTRLAQPQSMIRTEDVSGGQGKAGRAGRLFFTVALVLIGVAWFLNVRHDRFASEARHVTGKVVSMVRDGGKGSKPVVVYQTPDGPRRLTGVVSSNPPSYQVGQEVRLLVDRGSGEARFEEGLERWFFILLAGGIGAVFLLISLVTRVVGRGS
jgi:ribosomal protein L7/L12